jgi:hypothetical protein
LSDWKLSVTEKSVTDIDQEFSGDKIDKPVIENGFSRAVKRGHSLKVMVSH